MGGSEGGGGNGVQEPVCQGAGSINGVNREVKERRFSCAKRLSVIKHGGFIFFAFADNNYGLHVNGV